MTKKALIELKTVLIVLLLWAALSATLIVTQAKTIGWFTLGIAIGMIMAIRVLVVSRKIATKNPDAALEAKMKSRKLKQAAVVTLFVFAAGGVLMIASPAFIVGWWILGVGVGLVAILHTVHNARTPEKEGQKQPKEQPEGQNKAEVA